MFNKRKMICIVCPIGCKIEVSQDSGGEGYFVTGNQCNRGVEYGIEELTNPTRILTSTVKLVNAELKRLPVRTDIPIPKKLIFECMKELTSVEVYAPVKAGTILISNILGTEANIIASRSVERD